MVKWICTTSWLLIAFLCDFSEQNLAVAAQIAEQVTDEVYDLLMKNYKILVGDASAIRIDSPQRRSRLSSSDSSKHGASDISITDSSHQSDHSPMVCLLFNIDFLKCFNHECLLPKKCRNWNI